MMKCESCKRNEETRLHKESGKRLCWDCWPQHKSIESSKPKPKLFLVKK